MTLRAPEEWLHGRRHEKEGRTTPIAGTGNGSLVGNRFELRLLQTPLEQSLFWGKQLRGKCRPAAKMRRNTPIALQPLTYGSFAAKRKEYHPSKRGTRKRPHQSEPIRFSRRQAKGINVLSRRTIAHLPLVPRSRLRLRGTQP